MVPITQCLAQSTNGKPVNLKLDMFGGSPFSMVKVDKIKKRSGTFSAMRRLLGFKVRPTISLSLRALPSADLIKADLKGINSTSTGSQDTLSPRPLFSLLPANIVLPRKSVLMAGLYRQLLSKELGDMLTAQSEAALPQSGTTKSQNVLLSAFPPIVADEAVRRVLMYLWPLEAPPSLFKKNMHQVTSNDLMQRKNLAAFREVVLRVYRAFNSPDAQPNPLNPIESASNVSRREQNVLNMVGLKMFNGVLFPISADMSGFNTGQDIVKMGGIDVRALGQREDNQPGILRLVPLSDHLYSPFSTQELLQNNHERAEF
jgi:hypothetical protein